MDVIAKLPDCEGQAADAVSAYTHVKLEDAQRLHEIPKPECPDGRSLSPVWKTQLFLLSGICMVICYQDCCENGKWKKYCLNLDEKSAELGLSLCSQEKKNYSCRCTWTTSKWLERSRIWHQCGNLDEGCWSGRTYVIFRSHPLGMHSAWMQTKWNHCWGIHKHVSWKIIRVGKTSRRNSCVVLWHGRTCSKVRWVWTGKQERWAIAESFKSLLGHQFNKEELESVGKYLKCAHKLFSKCLYLARIGRPDILWSVNKLARAVTKWTQACKRRVARLISYIHHTQDNRQNCHVCVIRHSIVDWPCSRILILLVILEDSKSTSGGFFYVFGSGTFVLVNWMCKKQTSMSHGSTESDIISLDAGLRMDGLLALDLWDM